MGRAKRHSAEKSLTFNQLDLYKKYQGTVQGLLQERCQLATDPRAKNESLFLWIVHITPVVNWSKSVSILIKVVILLGMLQNKQLFILRSH